MKTLFQLAIFMTLTVVCNVGYCQPDSTSDAPLQKTPTDQAPETTDDQASNSTEDKPQVEKSVKPGINKKYTNPKLDVNAYVKSFELESREIYLLRDKILAACEIKPGDTVADVGSGTGLFSRIFSEAVGETGWVYSVDISARFLEHINREAVKDNIQNITGVLCAENSCNLPPNSVDVFFICDTYHHFEYPKSTLASIKRALKPDGHMILIDFERIPGKTRKFTMRHVRAGKAVFRSEIQNAGFKLVDDKWIKGFKENYFLKFKHN